MKCQILGLFSKAIAQSGTSLAPWALPAYEGVAQKRARQLADYLDCYKDNDWAETIECLRKVPAKNITGLLYDFYVRFFDTNSLLYDKIIEKKNFFFVV